MKTYTDDVRVAIQNILPRDKQKASSNYIRELDAGTACWSDCSYLIYSKAKSRGGRNIFPKCRKSLCLQGI